LIQTVSKSPGHAAFLGWVEGASHGQRGAVLPRRGCSELSDIDRRSDLARVDAKLEGNAGMALEPGAALAASPVSSFGTSRTGRNRPFTPTELNPGRLAAPCPRSLGAGLNRSRFQRSPRGTPMPTCPPFTRCGKQPEFVTSMLNPKAGRIVHVFQCRCGSTFWA
jgi:hypothetical protein